MSDCGCGNISLPNGANGLNGYNAFTITTSSFIMPAIGSSVNIAVSAAGQYTGLWALLGQNIFITDGTDEGYFEVTTAGTQTTIGVKNLGYTGNAIAGSVFGSGSGVSPAGLGNATGAVTVSSQADTQLPTTTSLSTTLNGSDYEMRYIGRNYKMLNAYAPTTPGTTATTSEEVINSYTLPGGVLTTAGDKVRSRAEFYAVNAANQNNAVVRIRIGGLGGTAIAAASVIWNLTSGASVINQNLGIIIITECTYISATSVRLVISYQLLNALFGQYNTSVILAVDAIMAVPTFASSQAWVVTIDDPTAGYTECRLHTLEFIPKV